MNKAQLKAKKARVDFNRNLRARSIAGRFGEQKHPKGIALTMDEFAANGGRLFKF